MSRSGSAPGDRAQVSVTVAVEPAEAFKIFTGLWWSDLMTALREFVDVRHTRQRAHW